MPISLKHRQQNLECALFFSAPRNCFRSVELLLFGKGIATLSFYMNCRHHLICFPVSYIHCSVCDGGQVVKLLGTEAELAELAALSNSSAQEEARFLCLLISFPKHELVACCSATSYEFKIGQNSSVSFISDECSVLTSDPRGSKDTTRGREEHRGKQVPVELLGFPVSKKF